jgi:hypothetical protein
LVRGVSPCLLQGTPLTDDAHLGCAGQKQGGQALIGGLDITVSRNFFGSQIESFETQLPSPPVLPPGDGCACARQWVCPPWSHRSDCHAG